MKNYLRFGIFMAPLVVTPAFAQTAGDDFFQDWVNFKDGEVSLSFNQTPVQLALDAFQAKTGFQIVVPRSSELQTVNLRLVRQPFEPAVRSLISTIGFRNFAMVYDREGRPRGAVVLGTQPPPPTVAKDTRKSDTPETSITIEERDVLKKDLDRWNELKQEERGRIEDRLRNLPPSDDREILVREYGRQVLALK